MSLKSGMARVLCQELDAFLDGFILFEMRRVVLKREVIRLSFGRPVYFEQAVALEVFNIHPRNFAL